MLIHQRLDLITEAVKYCQKVIKLGMPASCYSKALREPIFFLWELRHSKKKIHAAQFRSKAALGIKQGAGELIYDHAVPFVYLQRELLSLTAVDTKSVHEILMRYGVACLITKSENAKIDQERLQRSMPKTWDGSDPLARYHAVGIEVVPNPDHLAIIEDDL